MFRQSLPALRFARAARLAFFAASLLTLPTLQAESDSSSGASVATVPHLDQPYKRDPWRHDDGSYRYALKIDGGVAQPAGSTRRYQNLAGGFGLGAGYNLNKHTGAMLEYSFNDFGVPGSLVYQLYGTTTNFGARVHIWSFTLNPVVNVVSGEATSVYVTGGGGFYRKLVPFGYSIVHCGGQSSSTCQGSPPSVTNHYSNNAGGLDLGTGITHRITLDSKVRAFAEARYTWIDNQTSPNDGSYAPAYYRTGYFPIVVGLKW